MKKLHDDAGMLPTSVLYTLAVLVAIDLLAAYVIH